MLQANILRVGLVFSLGWEVMGNSFHFNGVCHGILGSGENGMREGI